MEAWNAAHSDLRTYTDWRRFSADCRDSYSRITGTGLDWRRDVLAAFDAQGIRLR